MRLRSLERAEAERCRKTEEERVRKVVEERKRAREGAHQTHLASLETIQAGGVEWDEWVEQRNKYGGKTRTKVTERAGACTLKFSGERVYILLANGKEIIKARRNVRWTNEK